MNRIIAVTAIVFFALSLAPATEPELNRAPWYEPRQLFVMTGFIATTTTGVWGADFIVDGEWSIEKQQAALKRLEQIVDSTGLNKVAESENVDIVTELTLPIGPMLMSYIC